MSFVGRFVLFRSVLYWRFHCTRKPFSYTYFQPGYFHGEKGTPLADLGGFFSKLVRTPPPLWPRKQYKVGVVGNSQLTTTIKRTPFDNSRSIRPHTPFQHNCKMYAHIHQRTSFMHVGKTDRKSYRGHSSCRVIHIIPYKFMGHSSCKMIHIIPYKMHHSGTLCRLYVLLFVAVCFHYRRKLDILLAIG